MEGRGVLSRVQHWAGVLLSLLLLLLPKSAATRCALTAAAAAAATAAAAAVCRVNLAVFKQTGHMHEKYDVTKPQGDIGGGGEYAPQVGFGWSNGVALHFLANYC